MAIRISKSEFVARMSKYMRHIETTGEVIVLTGDHGRPVLEIGPYIARPESKLIGAPSDGG